MSLTPQQFHDNRVLEIEDRTGKPVPLEDRPYVVMHLIPEDSESTVVSSSENLPRCPTHPRMSGGVNDYTIPDGRVVRKTFSQDRKPAAYAYLDRKGWFEGVFGGYSSNPFPSEALEDHYRWWAVEATDTLETIDVDLPITAFISLLGYRGSEIAYPGSNDSIDNRPEIPSSQIEGSTQFTNYSIDKSSLDRIFAEVWTQCGFRDGSLY